MNAWGEICLSVAVLLSAVAILAALFAVRFGSRPAITAARCVIAAMTGMYGLASFALVVDLLRSDFSVTYISHYTERALPFGYKLAAFWAGQEGSLLLWALLLGIMSTIAVFTLNRAQSIGQSAAVIATLAAVCAFFGLLILFSADPFAVARDVPADGNGLNPMLQDSGMIAHPPMLFLGYAGFTVPFALMVGALLTGQRDDRWVGAARRWSLVAWLFLTVGILLGAKWAYTELGWGGYWGWDPVENASLLPWLTGTALLHSLMVQQQRGMFRIWNAFLLAVTFILCIFGTYVTRSGLVDSVHSFGQSLVGDFFLAFLIALVLFSVGLIVWRIRLLKADHKLESLLGREGAFLAVNILLSAITVVVLIGTVFPAITGGITGTRTTLGPTFYNKVFGPVAMLVVALMATGPLQGYGKDAARRLKSGVIAPAVMALLAAAALWFTGVHNGWAAVCAAITTAAAAVIVIDLVHAVILQSRAGNPLLAVARVLNTNHRRYGAQLSHLGVVMMLVGVTGSGVFSHKQTFTLNPGESAEFSGNRLTLADINQTPGPNYSAIQATITSVDANGQSTTLQPQRRFYDKWEDQPNSVVAIQSSWKQDLYLNLAGWEQDGKNVSIEVIINPLVSWLWIGGWVVGIGGVICLIPRFKSSLVITPSEKPMTSRKPALATAVAVAFAILTPASTRAQDKPQLPPGHPDLSQLQQANEPALPPGHPALGSSGTATTQPAFGGAIKVHAVQATPGGPAIGGDPVTVELFSRGQPLDASTAKLGADGKLNVAGLPIRFGVQALVRVTHGGVVFSAISNAIDPEHPIQNLDVPVYESTTTAPDWSIQMRHVMVHPVAGGLEVTEMLAISTPGDHAWVGNNDHITMQIPLASGAVNLKVAGGLTDAAVKIIDGKLVSRQPLLPGEDRYQLQYTIPATNGAAALNVIAPGKVGHVLVFIPDDGTTITTSGLQAMGSQQMDESGAKTRYYMATSLEAGQSVALTVTGLKSAATGGQPATRPAASAAPADSPPGAPVEADASGGATVPKTIAAVGAAGILGVGGLLMLAKGKAPVQPAVQISHKSTKKNRHARR